MATRVDTFSNILVDMTATVDGKVYAVFSPSCELYEIRPDGTWKLIIAGLAMDTAGITADSVGDIYLVNSAGLFRLHVRSC